MPDRTVFITGCSSGIGRAAAVKFAERGYRVIATARNADDVADLDATARSQGWSLAVTACDVADEGSRLQAVEFAHHTFGPVHVLVNNAGYGVMGLIELTNLDDVRQELEVNTLGAMRLVQLLTPDMRAAGWGRIINISSIVAKIVMPFGGWYAASKFALEALNDALRLELHPFGIRVVSILPGPVKTDFIRNMQLSTVAGVKPPLYERAERTYIEYRKRPRPFEISADSVALSVVRAVEARNPRPRYYLTVSAKLGAFARRFMTDRAVDRMVRMAYGVKQVTRGDGI